MEIFNWGSNIIEKYKQIWSKRYCCLLEGDVYVWYKNYGCVLINSEQLLDATEQELTSLFKYAILIVLGGVGFAGQNKNFNVNNGIYRKNLSRKEETTNSALFSRLHTKVAKCAGEQKVIVLTHMPMKDWTSQKYHKGWIYISGHT